MENNLFKQLESFGNIPSGFSKEYLSKACDKWFENGHKVIISVKYGMEMFHSPYGAIPLDNIEVQTNIKVISFNQRDLNKRFG